MGDQLAFRFKGERNYIQGGDIFDVVEAFLAPAGKHILSLKFRHFTDRALALAHEDPGREAMTEGVLLNPDGSRSPFWLVETAAPVTDRNPYDESGIARHSRIDGTVIEAGWTPGFSVIEQIIAQTKLLNYAIAPDVDGKWVFAQLRLDAPLPATADRFRIRQKTLLAGRFSTQDIELDDRLVGEIRFITGKP